MITNMHTLTPELLTKERFEVYGDVIELLGAEPLSINGVVATDVEGRAQHPEAFITNGYQGVNYHRNTWHGVLTPIVKQSLFVVIDYIGGGHNLEEFEFQLPYVIDFSGAL